MTTVHAISPEHRQYLLDHAVTDEVIGAQGIRSEVNAAGQPEIVFIWTDGDRATEQRRPWPGEAGQYFWEKDRPLHFGVLRETGGPVLLVEGTKQSLAVASWAPASFSVYGMAGAWGWAKCDLSPFADRDVYVVLDGDAGDSLDVYQAGERLAEALELEDAVTRFVRLPVQGKGGADDYLASLAPDRRTDRLGRLVGRAKSKPADRRPTTRSRKPSETAMPELEGRVGVAVNLDRKQVIEQILDALKAKWDARELFDFGGALTALRGTSTDPLEKGAFNRLLVDAVAAFHYTEATATRPAVFAPAWPDNQTVEAVLASASAFSALHRIVRVPFIRPDGTLCDKPGYDPATRTVLVLAEGMDRLSVPLEPTRADTDAAVALLLDDWLCDMPFHGPADRANALALVLTPFVRGSVPLVPLAVVSGLQMGVGKNLLADCLATLVTGSSALPLPYVEDEDETRKQITSAFRSGADLFVFDEAHVIEGKQFARAITSITYTDRLLGVSKMVEFPNQVTWVALGNQVQVNSDMSRRVYFIRLRPGAANPQDREASAFRHPELLAWTAANRPELCAAVLTLVRAWHAAGCPQHSRGSAMGSFEAWDRTVSGILAHAGVEGFLGDAAQQRSESDFTGSLWSAHVAWLRSVFEDREFTTGQVKDAALRNAATWEGPPGMEDVTEKGYTRKLGQQYARQQDRWYDGLRLLKSGIGHMNTIKWTVSGHRGQTGVFPVETGTGPANGTNDPDRHYQGTDSDTGTNTKIMGVRGVTPASSYRAENTPFGLLDGNLERVFTPLWEGPDLTPVTPPSEEKKIPVPVEKNEDDSPAPPAERPLAGVPDPFAVPDRLPVAGLPGAPLVLDLETGGADEVFTHGDGYVRLVCLGDGSVTAATADVEAGLDVVLQSSGPLLTVNGALFDLPVLDVHHGIPVEETVPRVHDMRLVAFQADPPTSQETKPGPGFKSYSMDALLHRYAGGAKSADGKALAKEYGGWGRIPDDDPRFLAYGRSDVDHTRALARYLPMTGYDRREACVAAVTARATISGFRTDVRALEARVAADAERAEQGRGLLVSEYGFPLLKSDGKPAAKPQSTKGGKAAFLEALAASGFAQLDRWPRGKDGTLSMAKEVMQAALSHAVEDGNRLAELLVSALLGMNGIRTNAANILRCVVGDRVHPRFEPFQSTGRWSVTDPGLTVCTKGAPDSERQYLVPDDGDVIVCFDADQVDIRGVAGHSQDPALMEIMCDPARNIHREVAQQAFGDWEEAHYKAAKTMDLGWLYGRSVNGLAQTPGMTRAGAEAVDASMRGQFLGVLEWQDRVRALAESGALLDNGFGRNLRCVPGREYTQAPAVTAQSATRDMVAEGLLVMRERYPHLVPRLRVIVHDEIAMSLPQDRLEESCAQVVDAMTTVFRGVPITWGASRPGDNWNECYLK